MSNINKAIRSHVEKLEQRNQELMAQFELLRGVKPELSPRPPCGYGLPRYGIKWNGPKEPLTVPMDDGYWTPWHLASAHNAEVKAQAVKGAAEALYKSGLTNADVSDWLVYYANQLLQAKCGE